jgi:hypothetical protein
MPVMRTFMSRTLPVGQYPAIRICGRALFIDQSQTINFG